MKPLLFYVIFPILTASLTLACSNNEDVPSSTQQANDVSSQDNKDLSEPKENDIDNSMQAVTKNEAATTTRSADSHTHGDAELAVVLEDGTVTIEFESPLFNILGFEHAPETTAQKARVGQAETQLGQGAKLFTFNTEAGCKITSQDQAVTLFGEHEADHDDHEEHNGHAERKGHDHDDHDEDTHKDVLLNYEFLCQTPSALTNVGVNLFEFFKELSEVDVTYLGPWAQRQVTLSRNNARMDVSQ